MIMSAKPNEVELYIIRAYLGLTRNHPWSEPPHQTPILLRAFPQFEL